MPTIQAKKYPTKNCLIIMTTKIVKAQQELDLGKYKIQISFLHNHHEAQKKK